MKSEGYNYYNDYTTNNKMDDNAKVNNSSMEAATSPKRTSSLADHITSYSSCSDDDDHATPNSNHTSMGTDGT